MSQPKDQPLFTVSSHHPVGTGRRPSVDGDEANTYHSYFENRYGEQSIFIYRRATGEALLYCGDAEWKAFPVVNAKVQDMVISPDEELWLLACLQASGAGK